MGLKKVSPWPSTFLFRIFKYSGIAIIYNPKNISCGFVGPELLPGHRSDSWEKVLVVCSCSELTVTKKVHSPFTTMTEAFLYAWHFPEIRETEGPRACGGEDRRVSMDGLRPAWATYCAPLKVPGEKKEEGETSSDMPVFLCQIKQPIYLPLKVLADSGRYLNSQEKNIYFRVITKGQTHLVTNFKGQYLF